MRNEVPRSPETGLGIIGESALRIELETLEAVVRQHLDGIEEGSGSGGAQGVVAFTRPLRKMTGEQDQRYARAKQFMHTTWELFDSWHGDEIVADDW